jgi:hypothetical protein
MGFTGKSTDHDSGRKNYYRTENNILYFKTKPKQRETLRRKPKISPSPCTSLSRYHWTTRPFERIYQLINLEKGQSIKHFAHLNLLEQFVHACVPLLQVYPLDGALLIPWQTQRSLIQEQNKGTRTIGKNSLWGPNSPNLDLELVF